VFTSIPMQSCAKLNQRLAKRYERWMVIQHYSSNTMYKRARTIRLFSEFLRGALLTRATHLNVRSFLADLSDNGVSLPTANDHLTTLRMFYDFLNLGGMVGYVPPRLVRIRTAPRKLPEALSEPDVVKLIKACKTKREKAVIELSYGTGCRAGEMRNLKIEDVDFTARTVRLTGKTGTRIVPLGLYAQRALRDYIRRRKVGFVFQNDQPIQKGTVYAKNGTHWTAVWRDYNDRDSSRQKQVNLGRVDEMSHADANARFRKLVRGAQLLRPESDQPLSHSVIAEVFDSLGRRAGLRNHIHSHMLRHSFATHLMDRGADVRTIQELLGHKKLESTAVYTHLSTAKIAKTYREYHPRGA
jgi:integrase/recombinase XerC